MALYQLTLFYPSLKAHANTVRQVRADVEAIAGKNWRVLSSGEQVCAIGFESDAEHTHLRDRFDHYRSERFQLLLVEVSAVVGGYLSPDVWQWLFGRLQGRR